jgi:L-ascorbate metabolism protein UlaG (beta-lactamase superfamily)
MGMPAPTAPLFDGQRFANPNGAGARPLSDVVKMMREERTPWPRSIPVHVRQPDPLDPSAWAAVTFVGHSTFVIQTSIGNIITDPVFSERASPLSFIGPRRVREAAVPLDRLPPITMVLLSHNHYDHCDLPALRALHRRFDPLLLTPLGNARLARAAGFTRIEELDWWQRADSSPMPVIAIPAQHFSARTPFDRNRALWSGFMVEIEGRRLLFAGDSGYGGHFVEIHERLGPPDLALLPIGAYEPRWFMQPIHMNPEEAVRAHLDVGALRSVGMHFGTFQLTSEGVDEPVAALGRALRDHGVADGTFATLDFGASIQLRR